MTDNLNNQHDKINDADMQMEDAEEERKKGEKDKEGVINILSNNQLLFNQNDVFAENNENKQVSDDPKLHFVAIKKAKINSFTEKDGIPCSSLREIKIL